MYVVYILNGTHTTLWTCYRYPHRSCWGEILMIIVFQALKSKFMHSCSPVMNMLLYDKSNRINFFNLSHFQQNAIHFHILILIY